MSSASVMVIIILYFSVKNRLLSEEGMNFTEFSYQVFQSYDWLHLYSKYGCNIQVAAQHFNVKFFCVFLPFLLLENATLNPIPHRYLLMCIFGEFQ